MLPKLKALGNWYLLAPVLTGALILLLVAVISTIFYYAPLSGQQALVPILAPPVLNHPPAEIHAVETIDQ